jgi:gliding motility-associated-like protein
MRKLLAIVLLLNLALSTKASHILGGEITYTHVANKTYKINITLYRDCNDSKLNGQGGGSSNSNSSDLTEAFVRTITSTCGNKNLDNSIQLTKLGYENITAICNLNNSACASNPSYAYGTEAHYYEGTINFDNYNEYSGCPLHIFVHIPERSSSLSTIAMDDNSSDIFYNYVYINPWLENHNSPKFATTPYVQYTVNQAVYGTDATIASDNDSLVYKWSTPQKSHNSNLSYNSAFSSQQFISTYCPSGCTPNPNSSPPTGLWINTQTGDYVFTPTAQNQLGIRVLEVEQWRKVNNVSYLASKIRRDIQIMIVGGSQNNNPTIQASTNYSICVGEPFSLGITTSDIPATATSTQDSVALSITHFISGLTTSTKTDTALQSAILNFTPTSAQVGEHRILVKARDNHCPKYGESFRTIIITVNPKPSATLAVEDLFCGNLKTTIAPANLSYSLSISQATKKILNTTSITTGFNFQHSTQDNLLYNLIFSDGNGCTDSILREVSTLGNTSIARATLQGSTTYCENATTLNYLNHNSLAITGVSWGYESKWDTLDTLVANIKNSSTLHYNYTLEKNGLACPISDSSLLEITPAPIINTQVPSSMCFKESILKSELIGTPIGGAWFWNNIAINNDFNLKSTTPNVDTAVFLTYKYTDSQTGCRSIKEERIGILEAPKLTLRDQTICGDNYPYQLRNCIKLPYNHYVENITWDIPSHPGAYTSTPLPAINIPLYGTGTYTVAAINAKPNGCVTKDTAIITVTEDLALTWNQKNTLCQSDDTLDISDYFEVNAKGGGWFSFDNLNLPNSQELIPDVCGSAELHYVYDLNGCYDELILPINTLCKPAFSIQAPDSICLDADPLRFTEAYQWQGVGVTDQLFDPKAANIGTHSILATNSVNLCVYDTSITIEVVPPLDISLTKIPAQLCEGELLQFGITTPSYSTTSADYCLYKGVACSSSIAYTPTSCDLANGAIRATYTTRSHLACPAKTLSITIPYFEKPKITLAPVEDGCAPYALQKEIHMQSGGNPVVLFSVKNATQQFTGAGTSIIQELYETGKYTITAHIADEHGCQADLDKPISFHVWETPKAEFAMINKPRLALSEREIVLSNYTRLSSGFFQSKWYYTKDSTTVLFSSEQNPTYEMPVDVGQFEIKLITETEHNCSDTARNTVILVPDVIAFIPSAFSPDHKGPEVNSRFKVTSEHAQSIRIEVFNRWGQKVFSTTNIDEAWDGTFNGQYCKSGVYLYAIKLTNKSGVEYLYNGTVNLLR